MHEQCSRCGTIKEVEAVQEEKKGKVRKTLSLLGNLPRLPVRGFQALRKKNLKSESSPADTLGEGK